MNSEKEKVRAKYFILVFGAFAVFFTGYPHIWSIYQPYAMELTGWSQSQASMCFYLYFITFVLGNISGGWLQDQYNPRIAVISGGGIFTAGILLSAPALGPSPLAMYVTYGILQGFGQGMIYTTIISTAQKWFPEKTGFASGVIVTANGFFGFFMAPVSRALLSGMGIRITFLIFGMMIGISWILAGIFIKNPEKGGEAGAKAGVCLPESGFQTHSRASHEGKQYSAREMVKTRSFYFLLATMLFGLIPYMILSPLSQSLLTDRGFSASVAVGAVMAGSVCNAAARLALPTAADKVGRIICLKFVLTAAAFAMVLLGVGADMVTAACVVFVYACYGGIMGSFPSLTTHIFGMAHSGENYGYVMLGIAASTLGAPVITNTVLGKGYDMRAAFFIGAVCAAVSFLFLLLLEWDLKGKGREKLAVKRT